MKSYYFISGLPRSGSTLLSGILRQNPDFYADIASPINAISDNIIDTITHSEHNLTIEEECRKNLLHGMFEGYYKHIENPIIFDSSRNWTKKISFLQLLFPYTKILCCVRDIVSILNSFELIFSKNPLYSNILLEDKENVFFRCESLMDKRDGVVGKSWTSLKEGFIFNPKIIHFIEYDNLCKNPEKTMREVYEFLEKPYYSHNFENVEYSNENFDRACNLKDLHTVRRKVEYKPPRCVLPPEIVKNYCEMNMEFWRKKYKPDSNVIEKFNNNYY